MMTNTSKMSLNSVASLTAMAEPDVFLVTCNITDAEGLTYDTEYCSRPDDPYGLNPAVREWLAANPSFSIQPYVPPTETQTRASMPPLTSRQLRLGLVNKGLSLAEVSMVIEAMPQGPEKDIALIEWEYAATFNRMHPLVGTIGFALGLTDEQIDAMWMAAINH